MHEINETNYDGYLKLYQIYPLIRTKIIKKSIMKLLAYLIGILIVCLISFELLTYAFIMFTPILIEIFFSIKDDKEKWKKEIKKEYPDIDINIDIKELEYLLNNYQKQDIKIYEIKRTDTNKQENILTDESKKQKKKILVKKKWNN